MIGNLGRNPKSGEKVLVPGKYVPHFKAGKEMRERVVMRRASTGVVGLPFSSRFHGRDFSGCRKKDGGSATRNLFQWIDFTAAFGRRIPGRGRQQRAHTVLTADQKLAASSNGTKACAHMLVPATIGNGSLYRVSGSITNSGIELPTPTENAA